MNGSAHQINGISDNIKNGLRKIYRFNLIDYLILQVGWAIVSFVVIIGGMVIAFAGEWQQWSQWWIAGESQPAVDLEAGDAARLAVSLAAVAVILTVTGALLQIASQKIVLGAVKKQKTTLGDGFKLAKQRFWLAVRAFLAVFGVVILAGLIALGLVIALPPVGALAILALLVAAIYLALRLFPAYFLIVDDPAPKSVRQLFKKSMELSRPYTGTIAWHFLALIFVSLLISIITSWLPLINALASLFISVLFAVTFAELYRQISAAPSKARRAIHNKR